MKKQSNLQQVLMHKCLNSLNALRGNRVLVVVFYPSSICPVSLNLSNLASCHSDLICDIVNIP